MIRLPEAFEKARAGARLSTDEAVALLRDGELLELGDAAQEARLRRNPRPRVTFVVDTNPNYTNVCNVDCIFCAFYRHPGEEGEYTHDVDRMIGEFRRAAANGVTTVLLQGGVNPALPFEYYLEMVRRTVAEVPEVHPHFFSTSEILGMAQVSGLSLTDVLKQLWDAGLRTIPGGGAEILNDRVKRKISRLKGTSDDWIRVMREAHRLGYRSTATMMYGHIETDEELVEHLDRVRSLQDETGGFTAFVPWSFKPGNTPLEKIIPHYATPVRYLRVLAVSRLFLDNVDHVQASWFSEGKKTGQIALHFGADDFGGTLFEENVHAAANFVNKSNTDEVVNLIRESGFIPAQRDTLYNILRVYDPAAAA